MLMWANRLKESIAMMSIGDGMLALIAPRNHVALWLSGPKRLRKLTLWFAENPTQLYTYRRHSRGRLGHMASSKTVSAGGCSSALVPTLVRSIPPAAKVASSPSALLSHRTRCWSL